MRNRYYQIVALAILLTGLVSCSERTSTLPDPKAFDLSSVRLLDSPFRHAGELNKEYVMAHDPDRLLAPFLDDAGLEPKAPRYGNWENSGLDGHTCGHYLTSLSLMVASMDSEEAGERLNYMIDELARCQEANGNGYVGGIPGGQAMWDEIAEGNIDAGNFSLNDKWVPLYNIHKLFAGLHDAWVYAENEKARDVLVDLSDWFYDLCSGLSDDQIQEMLVSEHGGMNDVLADVSVMTEDKKYLELARRFSHREILDPLVNDTDKLTGLHANTQIPKVVGFMKIGALTNDTAWIGASRFFWDTVVNKRSVAIGGNSTQEHFHPADDFSSMIESRQGPETCNTYNMMKLSKNLYHHDGDLKYLDFYERALYNHILSSQHPEHGGLVYFTSMRPRHYRVYSKPEKTFWCCVGSGMENHAKYGELIYAHGKNALFVNLFVPSELTWEDQNVNVIQETSFPEQEYTTLRINTDGREEQFMLNIRHPHWLKAGEMSVTVNDKKIRRTSQPGEYFTIDRTWSDGDHIEVSLPMHTYDEQLPDDSPYTALMHGPLVLGASTGTNGLEGLIADDSRMGHVADGPLMPREDAPMLVTEHENWEENIRPVPGESLTFEASELIIPDSAKDLRLKPFYRIHDARYMVYWRTGSEAELRETREKLKQQEQKVQELEKRTIDQVATGEQQPESEHNFRGEETETGVHEDRHWRHATGWFAYDLNDPENEAEVLRITYFGEDADRTFDILINDEVIETVTLDGSQGDEFFHVDYPVADSIKNAAPEGRLTVKFRAHEGSVAGGVYDVRLMRGEE
ncbi:MAG: beta-L-arabinofuranosidase domain-containing protein [Marinilabiliaceae bacterium]